MRVLFTCTALFVVGAIPHMARGANILENGSFEDGLDGWTTSGTVFATEFEIARDFLVPPDDDWLPTDGDLFASIWSTNSTGTDASSLSIMFDAPAGSFLSFDYFFDYGDVSPFFDTGIGTLTTPDDDVTLFTHNTPGAELDDQTNVGWTTLVFEIDVSGVHELTFSATDANGTFESILGIDNVMVIPGPGVLGSVVFGLIVARRARRRR